MFLSFAVRNLRRHWIRSSLSIIGIVIGVIAIASLGIMGNSINLLVANLISDVGDTVVITPHTAIGTTFAGDPRTAVDAAIPARQVDEIRRAVSPHRVIPVLQGADEVEFGGGRSGYTQIIGLDPEDAAVLLDIEEGQNLRPNQPGALVGTYLAQEYDLAPGSRIAIGGETLRVTGTLRERGFAADINPDFAIVVPHAWYGRHFGTADAYAMVIVRVGDMQAIDAVKEAVNARLNRREETVDIFDSREMLAQYREIYQQITIFLVGIGAISLVIAAVNILNVMYISVTERIREVGILRSIGVLRREVLRMFLYEALILGLIGSVAGGAFSAIGGYFISVAAIEVFTAGTTFGENFTVFNLASAAYIVFGMLFGVGTSVAAGFYPAYRAAHLQPIEAMRHD
ncbi:MAG: ABC transporter permease [Methanomicrobiales archaeon]|nr:ABC transporter permease [Methanomicrobiales archaeon]